MATSVVQTEFKRPQQSQITPLENDLNTANTGVKARVDKLEANKGATKALTATASFTVEQGATYFISHASSVATSGTYTPQLYTYIAARSASSATASSYPAINPFRNKPFPDDNAWGPPWTSGDVGQHRLCFNFGETVRLIGLEWKGEGNTGYVGQISGPKDTTLRFATTPFSGAYNSSSGNVANLAKQWQNLQDGSSSSTTNGLAEYFDLKVANSNTSIVCSSMCIDMDTSLDGDHNMLLEHVLFWIEVPTSTSVITATVPSTVDSFTIVDRAGNFNTLSNVSVVVGADNIVLTKPQTYQFNKLDTKFVATSGGVVVAEGNV